nr:immunoglobulin sigma light chain [Acipenser ruthenus]
MRRTLWLWLWVAVWIRHANLRDLKGEEETRRGQYIFTQGTKLIVTAHQLPAPSVVVFQPSEEELSKGTATLVCLVRKLSGALVDISWTANETAVTSEVPSSRPSRESDGTFSVSSCLTISAAEWREDRVYSCIVQQGASLTQRSIQQSRC